jgi:hypothetical protein
MRRTREILLIGIVMGWLIGLSGCTTLEEPLYFYHPTTNEKGSFKVIKLNNTNQPINHLQFLKFSVKVQSEKNISGENIPLSLSFRFVFGYYHTESHVLIHNSSTTFITNASGVAETILQYDKDIWPDPRGWTEVQFEVTSPKVNNTAVSQAFRIQYYGKEISRKSNSTNGLSVLTVFEQTTSLETLATIGNQSENDYYNWSAPFRVPLINTSVLLTREQSQSLYSVFTYTANIMNIETTNISLEQIKLLWEEFYWYVPSINEWYTTGPLPERDYHGKWLIFQRIKDEEFSGILGGSILGIRQIAIVSQNNNIVWFGSFVLEGET